jgi:gliding motility-associated-like protein
MNLKLLSISILLTFFNVLGQENALPKWTNQFSKSESFIENLGQFDNFENSSTGKIHFVIDLGETRIFFGEKGVSYNFHEVIKKSKEERANILNQPKKSFEDYKQSERLAGKFLIKNDQVNLTWENSNSNLEIIGFEETSDYHSYTFQNKDNQTKNINYVKGYKYIIYKNIYPNIDLKYEIHPVIGVKYAFIVHPGANPKQIKMLYDRDLTLRNGEIIIPTLFGDIIDHAPISFYEGIERNTIESSYKLENNQISFTIKEYDNSQKLIIDPWVQTPIFPLNWDCVWELDTDVAGNVYVIGGVDPLQLKKYNSAGVLQWSYDTPYDTTEWLGTMATDDAGNTYVTEGTAYRILKVNTAGALVWNNLNPSGGQISTEFWNISFNCDQTKLIVGGTGGNLDIHGKIYEIDMNSGNITSSVQVTQAANLFSIPPQLQEVRAMTAAPNGKYYFATLDTIGYLNDNLTLCPGSSTSLFRKNHGVNWGYKSENWRYNNTGIKVIRADANFVYTHKGNALQKRSLVDFSIIASVTIPGGVLSTPFLSDNVTENAGIDIDNCGNIYVGSKTGVYKFNSSLVQQAFYPTSFIVYDLRVSTAGDIVACGGTGNSSSATRSGYVQSFAAAACVPIAITCCDASVCVPQNLCSTSAPVTLTAATAGGTWSGIGVNAAGVFNPSIAGIGTHLITYTLGCGSQTISILVGSCASLQVCEETNGNITVSGGAGPYTWTYTVTTSTTSNDCAACGGILFFGSCLGATLPCTISSTSSVTLNGSTVTIPSNINSVTVTDNGGTNLVFNPNTVIACQTNPCPTINVSIPAQTNVLCFGNSTGSATVSASGGAASYVYTWSPGALNGATQNNLLAGAYSVNVIDGNNCPGSTTVTITQPTASVSVSMASTPTNCGLSSGTATATASGGTGAYSYLWSPSGGNTANASNLASGSYSVTVTDANLCQSIGNVSVATNAGPSISTTSTSAVTCFGGNNGTATVLGSGGSGVLSYNWMPGNLSGATQNSLTAGNYTVTVTDAGGCSNFTTVSISQPTALTVNMSSTPTNCGATIGTATVIVSGGIGSYTYSWSPTGGSTSTATNLASGPFNVTITDANLCQVIGNVSIAANGGPTIAVNSSSDVTCYGGNNGSATVSGSGGSGTLSYSWMPGNLTGATQSALGANIYTITVNDGTCSNSTTVTINEPLGISLSNGTIIPANCGSNDGSATVNAVGGTGSYTYTWSPSGGVSATESGIAGGNYSVTVTDQNACSETTSIVVPTIGGPVITIQSITAVSCFNGNNGGATVTTAGGTAPYIYNWTPSGGTNSNATNLTAGTYSVSVTDNSGCTNSVDVLISESLPISISETIINANCGSVNGEINTIVTGGSAVYSYSWSPNGETTASLTNLNPGNYGLSVTDSEGCTANETYILIASGSLMITASPAATTIFEGESVQLNASGAITYNWTPSIGLSCTDCSNPIATPNETIIYTVTGTDATGCIGTTDVLIVVQVVCGDIYVPTVLSPNGTGNAENKMACVYGNCIAELNYSIYNRWGEKVFETGDSDTCWDGTYKGKEMNAGIFAYKLIATLTNGEQIEESGNLTLIK